jgi:hypothetical protein
MIQSVGIDLHQGRHRARCLDERAQVCDGFTFQTTPEGLASLEERIFPGRCQSRDSSGTSRLTIADGGRLSSFPSSRLPPGESQDTESGCPAAISTRTSQE